MMPGAGDNGDESSASPEPKSGDVPGSSQKRKKSKHIKKILKQRLNIDCLRMLCPDEGELMDPQRHDSGDKVSAAANSLSDSYHVLMREIGVEQNEDDGIS